MNTPSPAPCPRCGGEQIISKTWVETIQTYAGPSEITFSQITCMNAACQEAFDKARSEEKKKKEAIQKQRDENQAKRKAAALQAKG